MKQLEEFCEQLESARLVGWDELPDIELYRDQVIGYMSRQQPLQKESDYLTAAMVNNYTKNNMLPRANGKKYNKEHLAYLTAILSLKQVLSVSETDQLIKLLSDGADAEKFYRTFSERFGDSMAYAGNYLREKQNGDLSELAMQYALSAYASKMICQHLLEMLQGDKKAEAETENKPENK